MVAEGRERADTGAQVWIHQQRLHLVPLEHKSPLPFQSEGATNPSFEPEEEGFVDRSTAIALVRDPAVATLAPPELEEIVWARINGCVHLCSLATERS